MRLTGNAVVGHCRLSLPKRQPLLLLINRLVRIFRICFSADFNLQTLGPSTPKALSPKIVFESRVAVSDTAIQKLVETIQNFCWTGAVTAVKKLLAPIQKPFIVRFKKLPRFRNDSDWMPRLN